MRTASCWVGGLKSQGEEMTRASWRVNNVSIICTPDPDSDMLKRLVSDAPRQGPPWVQYSSAFQGLILTRRIRARERARCNKEVSIALRKSFLAQFKIAWHLMATNANCESSVSPIATDILGVWFSANSLFDKVLYFLTTAEWNAFYINWSQ